MLPAKFPVGITLFSVRVCSSQYHLLRSEKLRRSTKAKAMISFPCHVLRPCALRVHSSFANPISALSALALQVRSAYRAAVCSMKNRILDRKLAFDVAVRLKPMSRRYLGSYVASQHNLNSNQMEVMRCDADSTSCNRNPEFREAHGSPAVCQCLIERFL